MSNTFDIRIGSTVSFDGCLCTVIEIAGDAVVLVDGAKKTRRVRLVELLRDAIDAFGLPSEQAALTPLALIWADATEEQRDEARRKAAHVREMRTGFASGIPTLAQPHEPRPEFNPRLTTIHERRRSKAAELGVSPKTLKRWDDRFDEGEDLALLDFRKTSWTPALSGLDPRWVDMCRRVVEENVRGAKRSVTTTLAIVLARVKREYPNSDVRIPSESTAREAVAELTRGKGTFGASMRTQRSIETRPPVPYGRLVATRPGEYVVLDTTPLNVFGVAPVTGKWMRAELTVALDLYDRSILGLRLAPVSTKAVDVAGVLMEALSPREMPAEWGDRAAWPFHGVPENIVIDVENLKALRFRRPGILPDTIIIDHGKPFMSIHVASVCQRLGISHRSRRLLGIGPSCSTVVGARRRRGRRVGRVRGDHASLLVTYDPNLRPALLGAADAHRACVERIVALADIVKASDEALGWLYPQSDPLDTARVWSQSGPSVVVVTRGGDGADAVTPQGLVRIGAPIVTVVDTVGAGDTFMGTLIAEVVARAGEADGRDVLAGLDLGEVGAMLESCARAAAVTVSRPGADPPWRS
ncbi:PfkB family carbohydrate kinase [Microbacterium sp. HA-8]|uniref:PfkB family carbohydrate kinase n=1 Tax=Microbacterium sp. HA-8 TaxID=3234200 RepID=UPI0038F6F327